MFSVESAVQFAKTLKQCDECFCFILSFIHYIAYNSDKVTEINYHNNYILDKLEKEYQAIFSKPKYPIWEHRQLF